MGITTQRDIPRKLLFTLLDQAMAMTHSPGSSRASEVGPHVGAGRRVEVCAFHPGGGDSVRVGHLVDMTQHGVTVIYPGYLHHDTGLEVTFSLKGRPISIRLSCEWRRHLSGSYHLLCASTASVIPVDELLGAPVSSHQEG